MTYTNVEGLKSVRWKLEYLKEKKPDTMGLMETKREKVEKLRCSI